MGRIMVYVEQGDKEKAFSEIDEMAALAPESQFGQNVDQIKGSITEHLEMKAKLEADAQADPAEVDQSEETSVIDEAEMAEKEEAPAAQPESAAE